MADRPLSYDDMIAMALDIFGRLEEKNQLLIFGDDYDYRMAVLTAKDYAEALHIQLQTIREMVMMK